MMGWREVIYTVLSGYAGTTDDRCEVIADAMEERLLDMLETDRIALARELLAGTGKVVANEMDKVPKRCSPR